MTYLLDSNVVIRLLRGDAGLLARLRAENPDRFGLPVIVLHELFYAAWRSADPARNLARITALRFPVLPMDAADARMAAELRAALARAGTPIGAYDVLIAGQALARDLTVLTHNVREFARVPGLRVEDWEAATYPCLRTSRPASPCR